MTDWTNSADKVSRHFRVREAIYLKRWARLATDADGLNDEAKAAMTEIFEIMDQVRDFLDVPMIVHCAYRSAEYNMKINGAVNSYHRARMITIDGKKFVVGAVDFNPDYPGLTVAQSCDKGKALLRPELERFGLRMEKNGAGALWIHLDNGPVPAGGHREFIPAL